LEPKADNVLGRARSQLVTRSRYSIEILSDDVTSRCADWGWPSTFQKSCSCWLQVTKSVSITELD
jgi:hypothetical protein